jgi:CheY-like chemotaxis protein
MLPTVLVADESRGTRQLLVRQLRTMGWMITETSDGLETLDRLAERDADFAILDMSLRALSTVEVVKALRHSAKYGDLPIVAMGMTTSRTLDALLALGIDDFFVKPFTNDFLRERLQRFVPKANTRVRATAVAGGAPASAHGVAIVVDADAQFRDFASKVLSARYQVVEAASGVEALRACSGHRPAVVLAGTDTGLLGPSLLAEHLAQRADTARTAVVLAKAAGDGVQPHASFSAVLTKTFVIEDFERQLARVMGRSLVNGSPALTEMREAVEAATRQALGMMAGCDIQVVGRESADALNLRAWTDVSIVEESVTVRMVLRSDQAGAMSVAAGLLGMPAEDLAPEDGLAALGELVNVIAGRVKSTVASPARTVTFAIPALAGADAPWPETTPEVCVLFEPADHRFRLGVDLWIADDAAADRAKAA